MHKLLRACGVFVAAALLADGILGPATSASLPGILGASKDISGVYAFEKEPITYEYYTVDMGNKVPASWLFVGTYLMSAKAVSPMIYQAALESRVTYSQPIAFYRSELDNAEWKEIDGATSIANILEGAESVPEETLFPYIITVIVGDDGMPVDPRSGEAVDIYDMNSIYEMENIPELDILEAYLENGGVTWREKGTSNYLYRLLYTFFENDDLEYDREGLDAGKAITQYNELLGDRQTLEDTWDMALAKLPESYPEEYREIMTVMRNWPNIRDAVTDRADKEEEELNGLYLEIMLGENSEEADSVLYVTSQIDATRRAEVYYNLTKNDYLLGTATVDNEKLIDEMRLRQAELSSEIAQLSAEVDRGEAKVIAFRNEIYTLEDEIEELENRAEEIRTAWDQEEYDNRLNELQAKYDELLKDFEPVRSEYYRLDTELDEALSDANEINWSRSEIADEIRQLSESREKTVTDAEARIAELEDKLSQLKTRKSVAQSRRGELEEAYGKRDELESKLQKAKENLESEKAKLDELKAESDHLTTSRFTALVDPTRTYDPEGKQEADRKVSKQEKTVAAVSAAYFSADEARADNEELISFLEGELALDSAIEETKNAISDAKADLDIITETKVIETDSELYEKQQALAEEDSRYQEALLKLKEKNDAYNEYEPVYTAAKAVIDEKEKELEDLKASYEDYTYELDKVLDKIDEKEKLIRARENDIAAAQIPVDALNERAEALSDELESLPGLISAAQAQGANPYDAAVTALNNKITGLGKKLSYIEKENDDLNELCEQLLQTKADLLESLEKTGADIDENLPAKYGEERQEIEARFSKEKSELEKELEETEDKAKNRVIPEDIGEQAKVLTAEKSVYVSCLDRVRSILDIDRDLNDDRLSLQEAQTNLSELERKEQRDITYSETSAESGAAGFTALYADSLISVRSETEAVRSRIEYLENEIKLLEENREALLNEGEFTGFEEGETFPEYRLKLLSIISDYNERIAQEKEKDAEILNATELNRRREELIIAIDENESNLEIKLSEAEEKYNERLDAKKAERERILTQIKENEEKYNESKNSIEELKVKTDEVKKSIEAGVQKKDSYSKMASSIGGSEAFGAAPTLYFLRDAAFSGNPEMGRKFRYISDYSGYKFETNEELLGIIEDAIEACEASYEQYRSKSLSKGETAAEYTGYLLARATARNAADVDAALPYLRMITDLRSIEAGDINHADREISLLYGWLIPFAMSDFATGKGSEEQRSYQYYIQALTDRETTENSIVFVEGRLEYAKSLKASFNASGASDVIESHIKWLESLLKSLKSLLEEDSDGYDDMTQQALEEYERALEEGNLVRARMIQDLLNDLIDSGEADEDDSTSGKEGTDSDAEDFEGESFIIPDAASEMLETIIDEINFDGLTPVSELGKFAAVGGSLEDLLSGLEGNGAPIKYINDVKTAIAGESADNAGGTGGGDGDGETTGGDGTGSGGYGINESGAGDGENEGGLGAGNGGSSGDGNVDYSILSPDSIDGVIRDIMDGEDDEAKAAAVALLAHEAETNGNSELYEYARRLLDELLRNGSTCVYHQYLSDASTEYVSLGAIDKCRRKSGFRYVRRGNDATMSQMFGGSASYTFTIGQSTVTKNDGKTDTIAKNAVEQTDRYLRNDDDTKYAYIAETDAKKYLGCECVYIRSTDWAILVTPGVAKKILELADIISEMAERGEL